MFAFCSPLRALAFFRYYVAVAVKSVAPLALAFMLFVVAVLAKCL